MRIKALVSWMYSQYSATLNRLLENPMLSGLRSAIYPAPDITAARDWYAKVLGVQPYFDEPFYVGFAVGGFELGLLQRATPSTDGPQPLWGVDDVQATYDRLIALGAKPLEPPKDVGGDIIVADVEDPFGNRLGLIFNPHFKASEVR